MRGMQVGDDSVLLPAGRVGLDLAPDKSMLVTPEGRLFREFHVTKYGVTRRVREWYGQLVFRAGPPTYIHWD